MKQTFLKPHFRFPQFRRKKSIRSTWTAALLIVMIITSCSQQPPLSLLQYVRPLVGTAPFLGTGNIGRPGVYTDAGQTIPAVTAPFGMTQFTPQTRSKEEFCLAPYYFLDGMTEGIRVSHWTSGSCLQDYGSFTLAPVAGQFTLPPRARKTAHFFDNDSHSPAYCAMHLPAFELITEITATKRCGFLRISWLNPEDAMIVIDVNNEMGKGYLRINPEQNEIVASNPVSAIFGNPGEEAGFSGHIVIRFDTGFSSFGTYSGSDYSRGEEVIEGKPEMGGFVVLKMNPDQITRVKVGTSFTSIEQARKNLEAEIPDWNFDKVRHALELMWEEILGRVEISGGSREEMEMFYTALYHSMIHPRLFSDFDGTYPGFGGDTLHYHADGFDYYTDFAAGETCRAQMPLVALIAPEAYRDMIQSLITAAGHLGWLPRSPLRNGFHTRDPGDYSAIIIGDAIVKGVEVNREEAWKYIRKNCFETSGSEDGLHSGKGRPALGSYLQFGYIPLEVSLADDPGSGGQVSASLGYMYADWVAAQVARIMGEEDDMNILLGRAQEYGLLFDDEQGWINGRYGDGTFYEEFYDDGLMPWLSESTPRQSTWSVPHDIPGLITLMGGEDKFREKLKTLFREGTYWHGHGPSYHIPYLFNYTGDWDKTQQTVDSLLLEKYNSNQGGLAGHDDAGQLSAWYVFSAMGFYPVCPGSDEYQIGAPRFPKLILHTSHGRKKGKPLTIQGEKGSAEKPFTSVTLNGTKIEPRISHQQLIKGGRLVFDQK